MLSGKKYLNVRMFVYQLLHYCTCPGFKYEVTVYFQCFRYKQEQDW